MKAMKTKLTTILIGGAALLIHSPSARAQSPLLFGAPQNLGSTINTPSSEEGPTASADGLTLIFGSARAGGFGDHDLWMATRATLDEPFGLAVNLGPQINTPAGEVSPDLSTDGLTLLFASLRVGGLGNIDLWMSTRNSSDGPWTEAVNVGSPINSVYDDGFPCLSADGLELYFSDTPDRDFHRPGGMGGTDIWVSKRSSAGEAWGQPMNLGNAVNSSTYEAGPSLSPDGLRLFFGSYRSGTMDLWMSVRSTRHEPWQTPTGLGRGASSSAFDDNPFLMADGVTVLFQSQRQGGSGSWDIWSVQVPELLLGASAKLPFSHPAPDWGPDVSADDQTLLFTSVRPGGPGAGDLWRITRPTPASEWGSPEPLSAPVNTEATETSPRLSTDGLELYFSDWLQEGPFGIRPGGLGGGDLWVARRETVNDAWAEPENLGAPINTADNEGNADISADGLTLIFDSDRPGGHGGVDLWIAKRGIPDAPWTFQRNLPAINTPATESVGRLSSDGLILLFQSDREGGQGSQDLWMTQRASPQSMSFEPPVNLGPAVNTSAWEGDVALSPGFPAAGSSLYFTRGVGPAWNIYEARVIAPGPRLRMEAGRVLSWPAIWESYAVQTAPEAQGPWSDFDGLVRQHNYHYTADVSPEGPREFFRLVKP